MSKCCSNDLLERIGAQQNLWLYQLVTFYQSIRAQYEQCHILALPFYSIDPCEDVCFFSNFSEVFVLIVKVRIFFVVLQRTGSSSQTLYCNILQKVNFTATKKLFLKKQLRELYFEICFRNQWCHNIWVDTEEPAVVVLSVKNWDRHKPFYLYCIKL